MKNILFILLATCSFQTASASRFAESNSGVKGPPYEQIIAQMQSLAKQNPTLVQYFEYGRSLQGQPLAALKIANLQAPPTRALKNAVLVSGVTHGDEFLGFEHLLAQAFVAQQQNLPGLQAFLGAGGAVYIIPILNPDGYRANERVNAAGIDLNRDFPVQAAQHAGFTQPETRSLAQFVDQELRRDGRVLRLSVDYHCCYGAMLYPWSFAHPAPPTLPKQDEMAFLSIGNILKKFFGNYEIGQTPILLGYDAVGSTKDFYYENYRTLAFTFEGLENGAENLDRHVAFWNVLFDGVNHSATPEQFIRRF